VSQLNNLIKYLIIFLITFPIFGQVNNSDYSPPENTFKSAVEEYNNANYKEADLIIENISAYEKKYFSEEIILLSMRVKYRQNDYSLSKEIGKSLLRNYPNSKYKIDVLITFGDIFVAQGMYDAAFRAYIKSYKENNDDNYIENITKRILLTMQFGVSQNIPDELLSTEIEPQLIQILLLAKAHSELQVGKIAKASTTLSQIKVTDLLEIDYDYYLKLKNRIQNNKTGNSIIGVVLPLTGKDSKIGKEFLDGLKQAELNKPYNDLGLSFIVYDNAGDELKTLEAFQSLSNNPNIVAVIGPISTNNSIIAGSIAERNGIPLILPMVTSNDLSKVSNNIFMLNSDLKTRGELAGQLIAESFEAENIAVLAPADKFGKSIVDAFVNQLNLYNKAPQIIEWYSDIPMNLDRQFKSIRAEAWELSNSTDSLEFSYTFVDSIITLYGFDGEEMTADDSSKVVLNSIDAIYMPIHEGHLDYMGAQFPAYNLDAAVIGNDYWADLDVLRKENIGPHFSGLVVISNYNDCQLELLNNYFNKKHTGNFYKAIDSYNLLAKSIEVANTSDKSLLQILSNINDFKGIFGTYNFAESDNNVNSKLNIVQFDGYNFDTFVVPNQSAQY